ncbi:hypothetical protein LJC47_04105 [Desulfosarcina sp. OttesenSCG-928-B08]|nr:hypothetical protein [Desulfosarcina sp. OttesenSCG-928-B08]
MNKRMLLHQLRRGIGSAIMELKAHPDTPHYREIVLGCCLKDISHDTQVEGTKGHYLYTAIQAIKCEDAFIQPIVDAYLKPLPFRLFYQLNDILKSYAHDGSAAANTAFSQKYDQLRTWLLKQKQIRSHDTEPDQLGELMGMSVVPKKHRWNEFTQMVEILGAICLSQKNNIRIEYDWLLIVAENQFGAEKVWQYLNDQCDAVDGINALVQQIKKDWETYGDKWQAMEEERPTLDWLIQSVTNHLAGKETGYSPSVYARKFARQTDQTEHRKLAEYLQDQPDAVKAELLRVFRWKDYPLDIGNLIRFMDSGNRRLQQSATNALERFKDQRIHDAAIRLLASGDMESALPLFKANWKKADDPLIEKAVLKSRHVPHFMQMELREIYSRHRSTSCGNILLHAYRYGQCGFCRFGIIRSMGKNSVLPDTVLLECQYDSYADTRRYAMRRIKKHGDA